MDFEDERRRLLEEWTRSGGTASAASALGDLHSRVLRHRDARHWYRKALALAPSDIPIRDKLEDSILRGFEILVEQARRRGRNPLPLERRLLEFRMASLERRAQTNPSHAQVRFQLGHAYYLAGRTEAALEEFREALALPKIRKQCHLFLARCRMRRREYPEVLLHLSAAEELGLSGDERNQVRHLRGLCEGERGEPDMA